jgi:hypothetical protein
MIRVAISLLLGMVVIESSGSAAPRLRHAWVEVQDVGAWPPFESEFVAAYVQVITRQPKAGERIFYLPFLGRTRPMPPVGAECRLAYRNRQISGWIGSGSAIEPNAAVIDKFVCRPPRGRKPS